MAFISKLKEHFTSILNEIDEQGLTKAERIIVTPQGASIKVNTGEEVLNFCANNYLGLADNKELIEVAKNNLDSHGFGMSSVRFICGTQDIHKQLEEKISTFLKKEDTILYSSCFDANAGLFETVLTKEDAIISDELNHASIIDGVRLCKAMRYRFKNSNMDDLRAKLEEAKAAGARHIMIATDGVFSMDGYIAKLDKICDIADEYGAMVMVDDSHATGFVGKTGRGSAEHCGVLERIDIITSTLGKALGGASGGFTAAPKEIVSLLRQRSRPYLFSNTLTPSLTAAGIKVFEKLSATTELRDKLEENTKYFRDKMKASGFDILDGVHPIVPIMLYNAKLANDFADEMLKEGVYVIGFSFPVVPREKARIRVQISAGHDKAQLDKAIEGFIKAGKRLGVLKD
ncbi:MAG: glycine C-acetyltransferase [Planctomycetes bacterium]|nr:glycine C-acetyltransferase [Planctomycetota bacterium]